MELSEPAIITGAASGIGRGIALRFAELGCAQLALIDRNMEGLKETKDMILESWPHATVLCKECDLTGSSHQRDAANMIDEIVQAVTKDFGRVSHLVNCAGITGGFAATTDTQIDVYDAVQQLNVRATWLLQRAVIRQMLQQGMNGNERGSIVNIGSAVSHMAMPRLSPYVISKHAVLGLSRSAAVDYADQGIRVNCICPGFIETNLGKDVPKEVNDRELKPLLERTPMGRLGKPKEVADAVAFLCSRSASYITGTSLNIDGGLLS